MTASSSKREWMNALPKALDLYHGLRAVCAYRIAFNTMYLANIPTLDPSTRITLFDIVGNKFSQRSFLDNLLTRDHIHSPRVFNGTNGTQQMRTISSPGNGPTALPKSLEPTPARGPRSSVAIPLPSKTGTYPSASCATTASSARTWA